MTNPTQLIEQLVAALNNAEDAISNCQTLLGSLRLKGFAETCMEANNIAQSLIAPALTAARAHLEQPTEARAAMGALGRGVVWRCFHCDEAFTDSEKAAEHFGTSLFQKPACQIDITEYRKMEETHRRHCEEDTDLHREIYKTHGDGVMAAKRAEESGYARGLADAKKHPEELGLMLATAPQATEPAPSTAGERSKATRLTDEQKEWITDNPNTNDLVEFIEDFAYRAALLQSTALSVGEPLTADMFWNHDDAEQLYSSIEEFLNDEICNGAPLEVGHTRTIQRAVRLSNLEIRITSIDEESCDAEYEVVQAAHGITQGGKV